MKTRMHVLLFFCATLTAFAETKGPSDRLVANLIQVESGGRDNAIGDKDLREHAYGPLQIRRFVCDDVNERLGSRYTAESCLGNRPLSIQICRAYLNRYATASRLGHEPTDEDMARIWNGGPSGWKRACTEKYWQKVQGVRSAETKITAGSVTRKKRNRS